jgi:Domain of unknown function (DUF4275)
MNRRSTAIVVNPGPIERTLSEAEVLRWVEQWLAAFPANRIGIHADDYLWHIFSYERHPCASKSQAHSAYESQIAPEYVIISNDRDEGCITKSRPTACSLRDWLVFPPNLAWTMAFTHEDGWLGPYFAQSAKYAELDLANRTALDKNVQIAEAKRKGWI